KKQKGTVLRKVEQTEKKVGEKEKKVAQKNFKPEDAEKKQKGTVLKKVEQTEKKAVEKEERTPSKKMDQEKVTLKKQWKVVQKAAREEHEESSLIMEVQTSCRVDEKEKEIAHSFMQLKCEKTEEKQKAILLRTVEQTEIKVNNFILKLLFHFILYLFKMKQLSQMAQIIQGYILLMPSNFVT
ncbi:unnamed protein product, partial [Musa banksii]